MRHLPKSVWSRLLPVLVLALVAGSIWSHVEAQAAAPESTAPETATAETSAAEAVDPTLLLLEDLSRESGCSVSCSANQYACCNGGAQPSCTCVSTSIEIPCDVYDFGDFSQDPPRLPFCSVI